MTNSQLPPEFLSEAQEVVESFSRGLLDLDEQQREGRYDPDLVNAAFRAIHSLKGLASLFGVTPVAELSHRLESALDDLRLGRIVVNQTSLDVLFESVEHYQRMLAGTQTKADERLLARIEALGADSDEDEEIGSTKDVLSAIDESILGVLTEYEEHRLRENLQLGRRLYRVHASFDLMAIDVGIETLKQTMKSFGEVITYLPSADAASDDRIELDVLVGSDASLSTISESITQEDVAVQEISTQPVTSIRPKPPREAHPLTMSSESVLGLSPSEHKVARVELEPSGSQETEAELSLRSVSRTVRVDLARLDVLMNLVGELGVVQANLGTTFAQVRGLPGATDIARSLQTQLRSMERKLGLLQQGILDVRMVPLGQVFDKLARVVRKLGREVDKEIRLNIAGSDTELDKLIVEELSDPLMHMIRNCIDHGIESKSERQEAGKAPIGRIDLSAFQKGNRVVIEIEDDGRGMDWREIRTTAIRRGLITEEDSRDLGMQQVVDLIFVPGFTTRESATSMSGRGVGMDVVKTNISRLSGMIDVDTAVGLGTRFSITLPVTLAIIQALVIEVACQTFCIPLNSVLESVMIQKGDIKTVEGHEVISMRGKTLPLLYLSRVFELHGHHQSVVESDRIYVVIVGLAQHRVGLVVDELLGQQDVVIKPLGRALKAVPGIAGATEIAGGRTVLLLDVAKLVEEAVQRSDSGSTVIPRSMSASLGGSYAS